MTEPPQVGYYFPAKPDLRIR